MAKSIMLQGTMSNVGKSILTSALCRIFAQDGYNVAPFKSQNMALNSFVTNNGFEIGRAQAVQAYAAMKNPDCRMNPILLKPTSNMGSQVIVNGKSIGNMCAKEYFEYKTQLIPEIMNAYNSLSSENDIIVIEGAGSPAEINLKNNDIVNMGLAKMVDAPVLLIGDIDRGGVFAQLFGTIALMEQEERERIKGLIINKFRGDIRLLDSGLYMFTERIHPYGKYPFMGVVPYIDVDIDDEDSLSNRIDVNQKVFSKDTLNIAIIKLPRMSNYTDFNVLSTFECVTVNYIDNIQDLENADVIILPGTKSTINDLNWLKKFGFDKKIKEMQNNGSIIFGICGGYQILGNKLIDEHNTDGGGTHSGLGLLPIDTIFAENKKLTQITGILNNLTGVLSTLNNKDFTGYEIHCGISDSHNYITCHNNVYGTYIHGIFDKTTNVFVETLCRHFNKKYIENKNFDYYDYQNKQFNILADEVRKNLDMEKIYKIMGIK